MSRARGWRRYRQWCVVRIRFGAGDVIGLGLDDGVGDGIGRGVGVEFEIDDCGIGLELGMGDGVGGGVGVGVELVAGDGVGACTVLGLVAS